MIELLIVLPEYWNFYITTDGNRFPILLLSRITALIDKGLKIEEGFQILANDPNFSDLKWPNNIGGLVATNAMMSSDTDDIDGNVDLLTLLPIKRLQKEIGIQDIDKNRKSGWKKMTLPVE